MMTPAVDDALFVRCDARKRRFKSFVVLLL